MIRFNEFKSENSNSIIKNEFIMSSGSTPSTSNKKNYIGTTHWISSGELKTKYINSTINCISDEVANKMKIYKPGTVLLALYGLEAAGIRGTSSILKIDCAISQACMALESKGNILNDYFYCWYAKNGDWIGRKVAQGTKQQNLTSELLGNVKINYPTKSEQMKISTMFDKLDHIIIEQEHKINGLNEYRKSLINKIIINNDGNKTKLSDVLFERKEYSEKGQDYPHVTLSKDGIFDKGERYNRDFLVKSEEKKYKVTKKFDLCYNPANLKFGVICLNEYGSAIFSPIYVTFEIKNNCNPYFISYYLTSNEFIKKARKYEQGTVFERMSVSPDDLCLISINLPEKKIQDKLTNVIYSFDKYLKNEEKLLQKYKDLRKSLLNEMII